MCLCLGYSYDCFPGHVDLVSVLNSDSCNGEDRLAPRCAIHTKCKMLHPIAGGGIVSCFFHGKKQLLWSANASKALVFLASATFSSCLCNNNLSEEESNYLENVHQVPVSSIKYTWESMTRISAIFSDFSNLPTKTTFWWVLQYLYCSKDVPSANGSYHCSLTGRIHENTHP